MNAEEHKAWIVSRAMHEYDYVIKGGGAQTEALAQAIASAGSDMRKHESTRDRMQRFMLNALTAKWRLSTRPIVKQFIEEALL